MDSQVSNDLARYRSRIAIAILTTVALVGGIFYANKARSDGVPLTDVAAAVTAPSSATAPFSVTGKITNTGLLSQPSGSRVTINPAGGAVTTVPAGCVIATGAAVCTAGGLASGASQSFTVTVTPATNATAVHTVVQSSAAFVEVSIPPPNPNDDTASADTSIPYALSVDITNAPSEVRNGLDVILRTVVTNNGFGQSNITLSVNTGGTADTANQPLPTGCTASGATVTCSAISLATGQSRTFDMAIKTPATGTLMTSTATASGANSSSATDSIDTALSGTAAAFVPDGTSLGYTDSTATDTFSVPANSTVGLILHLGVTTLPAGTKCGTSDCTTQAVEATFDNSGTYSANNVNNPLIWAIQYNFAQTCNGKGTPSGCLPIYWIGSGKTIPQQIPTCPTYQTSKQVQARMTDINIPCLNFVQKTSTGLVTYFVALLKDITIPIISGSAK
jgi:hypothetical protein